MKGSDDEWRTQELSNLITVNFNSFDNVNHPKKPPPTGGDVAGQLGSSLTYFCVSLKYETKIGDPYRERPHNPYPTKYHSTRTPPFRTHFIAHYCNPHSESFVPWRFPGFVVLISIWSVHPRILEVSPSPLVFMDYNSFSRVMISHN